MMESSKPKHQYSQYTRLGTGIIGSYLLHFILAGLIVYGGLYSTQTAAELRAEIVALRKECVREKIIPDIISSSSKREIISDPKAILSSLVRGPPGPPGPAGQNGINGIPGTPGKDYSSLTLLKDVINETVQKEWSELSQSIPNYGGVTYIRWGRNSCSSSSHQIYRGYMAGASFDTGGGGANFQCLPSDPENDPQSPQKKSGHNSMLTPIQYAESVLFAPTVYLRNHFVPCVACETIQRVTKIMIPGKSRCPSSDWTVDYQGYIMSEMMDAGRGRSSYVCVDSKAEASDVKAPGAWVGGVIYPVSASCQSPEGIAAFPCPPYKSEPALSCVVCSK